MEKLITLVEKNKLANQPVDEFSMVIDDKQVVHGAIFVIKIEKKTFKLFIPEPHYKTIIEGETKPLIKTILKHTEVMLFM